MEKNSFTLNDISDDNQKEIASYLNLQAQNSFAMTQKRYLRNGLALLLQGQKLLLSYPHIALTAGSFSRYCFKIHELFAGGNNAAGDLGLGHNDSTYVFTEVKNILGNILQVFTGDGHTLVLTTQGLFACGYNVYGQLGIGHSNNCNILTPVKSVPGKIIQVVAGS